MIDQISNFISLLKGIVKVKYIINLAFFFVIYIYLIKPRLKRRLVHAFIGLRFAHRGLHNNHLPENSLMAFEKAVEAGVGIELDIQMTADNEIVVFHDDNLVRINGSDTKIKDLSLSQLRKLELFGSGQTIPTLSEVLELVGGRVPILIDIKPCAVKKTFLFCKVLATMLDQYQGKICIDSFNPMFLIWFRIKKPHIARGLLLCRLSYWTYKKHLPIIILMRSMILNAFARPDFIAYDYSHKHIWSISLCRFIFRVPIFAWTVPAEKIESRKLAKYHSFIYEE